MLEPEPELHFRGVHFEPRRVLLAGCERVPLTRAETLLGLVRDQHEFSPGDDAAVPGLVRMSGNFRTRGIRSKQHLAVLSLETNGIERALERRKRLDPVGKSLWHGLILRRAGEAASHAEHSPGFRSARTRTRAQPQNPMISLMLLA